MTRLKEQYKKEVAPALQKESGLKNMMEVPRLEKIVVNSGVADGMAVGLDRLDRRACGDAAHDRHQNRPGRFS